MDLHQNDTQTQTQTQKRRLILNQSTKKRLEILQMPLFDLQKLLLSESEQNPLLEIEIKDFYNNEKRHL